MIEEFELVLCLGFFDGVHLAHQKLLNKTIEIAQEKHLQSAMMTFSDHILSQLKGEKFYYLSSINDKIKIAENIGFDYFYVLEVSPSLISLPADKFIEQFLCSQSYIVAGFDFTFGQFGKGNATLLKQQTCFQTIIISEVIYHHEKIGSTWIRNLLKNGDLDQANYLLSRPFSIEGEVIHGKSRGLGLGFPTANILNPGYLSIKSGVYVGSVLIDNNVYYGLINVGNNPTFDDAFESIEVYIFDFNKQIYGKTIQLSFLHYIRDEIKFNQVSELIEKMYEDELIGRQFLKKRGKL